MKINKQFLSLFLPCLLLLSSCGQPVPRIKIKKLFTSLPAAYTNINFENNLVDEGTFNVFKYRNYYNGGGVAIGDINNDGLPDVYMTANQLKNKLYLNKGDLQFQDITGKAGVSGSHNWSTGVSMVDINGDGWLDIYVCNSGNIGDDTRANELFLNLKNDDNGVPQFRESAAAFGIDDKGFSTQAAFFDFDRDGDLDLYVLNNAFRALSTFDLSKNLREIRDPDGGDRLYRNDDGHFVDVSEESGILGSVIAFGLGISISDVNNDGWLDIYIANDFFERDYLYLNNQNGTFSEQLETTMRLVSLSSMGCDIGDLNNDGLMDIIGTDMLPEDEYRLKTTFTFESFAGYTQKVDWGYFHQVSRNVLQLNNGPDAKGHFSFTELGLFAGVARTDWSWSVSIADLNNDTHKDIFISNGIFRDVTDQDYIAFLMKKENIQKIKKGEHIDIPELINRIPSTKLPNYAFENSGNLTFKNRSTDWGLDTGGYSNGAAYGDLDNDGDLDLVINNVNQPAFVFRNESDSLTSNHYLRIKLIGKGKNRDAIGAKVVLSSTGQTLAQEQIPVRGFQSSVDNRLVFGLGTNKMVDSVKVFWPNGDQSTALRIAADQEITLNWHDATPAGPSTHAAPSPLFSAHTEAFSPLPGHQENKFNDFMREPLLNHLLSTEGPAVATGDVNNDGFEDVYIGGAKGSAGKLFMQDRSGTFHDAGQTIFDATKVSEDVDAAFFDADGDDDLDLYVVSGGNEFSTRAPALIDRLYFNDGTGTFSRSKMSLPKFHASGATVSPGDFDGDGDLDLFVGGRSVPWRYGQIPTSYLLENDGSGTFSISTPEHAPGLARIGMVTDSQWHDFDRDGRLDLFIAGEWMPLTLFHNTENGLVDITEKAGLQNTNGWWNCIEVKDINGDGFVDIFAGNLGKNSTLHASLEEPVSLYLSDFDNNGTTEALLSFYKQGKNYPLLMRSEITKHLPYLNQKFPTHAAYADKEIKDIFTPAQLKKADIRQSFTLETTLFYQTEKGQFKAAPLPDAVQFAPVHAIEIDDFDNDGHRDIVLGGNFYGVKPQLGRYDASYGTFLQGDSGGKFEALSQLQSGLSLSGQVRDITRIKHPDGRLLLLFTKNNDTLQVYKRAQKK